MKNFIVTQHQDLISTKQLEPSFKVFCIQVILYCVHVTGRSILQSWKDKGARIVIKSVVLNEEDWVLWRQKVNTTGLHVIVPGKRHVR